MKKEPTHCICGAKMVPGEGEIEVIPGVKMMVPGLFCSNHSGDCDFGFIVHRDVMLRAEKLARAGITKFS